MPGCLEVLRNSLPSTIARPDIHVLQKGLADASMCSAGLAASQREQQRARRRDHLHTRGSPIHDRDASAERHEEERLRQRHGLRVPL